MTYKYGKRSKAELVGVHPVLVEWSFKTLSLSPVDITVFDGLRTIEEQKEYVRRKVSRTMKSKHLKQSDGYGHAVDLVPYVNGKPRWEWEPIYDMMEAGREAAQEMQLSLKWGGVWDRSLRLLDFDLEKEVRLYTARRKKKFPHRKVFLDGPHTQILRLPS